MKRSSIPTVLLMILVSIFLALTPRAVHADTVDIVHDGYGAQDIATFWGAGYSGAQVYSGVYMLNKTSDTGIGDTWSNGLLPAFCIEIHEPVPKTTKTYDVIAVDNNYNNYTNQVMGSERANYLRELWSRYYDPAWAAGGSYTDRENDSAAAFAAAVWEILYEDLPKSAADYDVTTDGTAGIGGFYATDIDTATANAWLHSLDGTGGKADLLVLTNEGGQNFLVAVPEPTTFILLGLGGTFGLFGRKARERKNAALA